MSAARNGLIAELIFQQYALNAGWEIAKSVLEVEPWDYLIRIDSLGWAKVQVKKLYLKDEKMTVNMTRHGDVRYKAKDADWLAAVDILTGDIWLVPWGKVYRKTRVSTIRTEHSDDKLPRLGNATT